MYDMATLTVRIDEETERRLDDLALRSGRSRSEIVRDALRRQIALEFFEQLRRQVLPFAEARGYLTDDDVFTEIS
jgi:predicted transcriptional regulator